MVTNFGLSSSNKGLLRMGCGSSGQVVASAERANRKQAGITDGVNGMNGHHNDDLPTVVLPDTPAKPRPPIAYEIPIEEFDSTRKASSPPVHLQRLLQPPPSEIRLPDIKEKLAEAEQRRLSILQHRAVSAQKRAQRITRSLNENGKFNKGPEDGKHGASVLAISPEPRICEDKNI